MIKFMKANQKHRRSIIEDEDEAPSKQPKNKRLVGLNSTIKDELHQTGSENETRGAKKRVDYREESIEDGEDGIESKDISEDEMDTGNDIKEEVKDEFKDSGLESQPTSQDEEEVSSVLMEEVLSNMKKLTGDELPGDDARHRSPAQVEQLKMVFKVSMFLSKQQKAIMSEKLSIDPIKIQYWFADARKKLKKPSCP